MTTLSWVLVGALVGCAVIMKALADALRRERRKNRLLVRAKSRMMTPATTYRVTRKAVFIGDDDEDSRPINGNSFTMH